MSQAVETNSMQELQYSVFFPQQVVPETVELPPFVIPEGYMTLTKAYKENGLI